MSKPFSWSYTKLKDWENCGRLWHWKYVAKNKEPENEKQLWGERVHAALDERASGRALPAGMENLERLGKAIDKAKTLGLTVIHEKSAGEIAFTRELRTTGWFDKDVYGRVKIDLALIGPTHAIIIDYKTGKKKDDETQLKLFAGTAFIKYPEIQTAETRYVWTNGAKSTVSTYKREDVPWIWNEILPRVDRMESGVSRGQWTPRPSGLCRFCPVTACEHNTVDK